MKQFAIILSAVALAALLSGCSTPSLIILNDGQELQTLDKPKFDKKTGFYEFRQLDGKSNRINKDQVQSIKQL
ncbi:YgdI/YgdR family lipoprotein [Pseudomonas daroniae]|uniref:YgdI/YgdR family lipoprotein n=2 Tax=Phytopseudomonas TaxID=3236657 RepID=A0A4Q9R626_9GAMM|nr:MULTISPECIES: YgdI/YgdR family lipoprotein [Pseudomonas]TBU74582.1 YgdI/YgdR family lipoprotein [Pseudomonas daroniae]TBU81967.1 YgdI/YgdR family lipoprotein [Pseudomonas daroniae]TBU84695.1 YgdI/YgdR family lipoprotein [Pseudomonas sp. FRB 228]TBU92269.1 YgdI/YgdR family lipoprotein [Pseudomonas daroniae]TBU95394.1 YgdI/YgdR family lipoprotein [Pseudomonas dryadis]